jgi:hypothetical protein
MTINFSTASLLLLIPVCFFAGFSLVLGVMAADKMIAEWKRGVRWLRRHGWVR